MTECTSSSGPTTRAEFETALRDLIRTADANGVSVAPGIDVRDPSPGSQDWTVEIYPLRSQLSDSG